MTDETPKKKRGGARPRGTSPRGPLPPFVSFFKELCRTAHFVPHDRDSNEAIKYCRNVISPWIEPHLDAHLVKMGPSTKSGKYLPAGRTLAWYGDTPFHEMADIKDLCATTDKGPRYRLGGKNMKENSSKGNMSKARNYKWLFCAEKLRRGELVSEQEVLEHFEFLDRLKAAKGKKKEDVRRPFPEHVKRDICLYTIEDLGGICPCCRSTPIFIKKGENWDVIRDENGKALAEYDHWNGNHDNRLNNGWRICKPCHDSMNYHNGKKARDDNHIHFTRFQAGLDTWNRMKERLKAAGS